jgi:hypothetical protein
MESPRTNLNRPSRAPWVVAAVALVAVAVGLYLSFRQKAPEPAPAAAPVAAAAPVEAAPSTGPAPTVPADRLRSLLEGLSADAGWRSWLGTGDLVRRFAVAVDNLAEGESPRKPLDFLKPEKPFAAAGAPGKLVIAPASYRRFDAVGTAVASLDAPAAARAYRELHPVLEAAWRALGYPKGSLDRVVSKALKRLEQAPVREGAVALVPAARGTLYEFADRRLEDLGPVEKHLLRMGPENTRRIQAKARELRAALGLVEGGAAAAPAR